MKTLLIILSIFSCSVACDPIDQKDHNRSTRQRAYANYCVDTLWHNPTLAEWNRMENMSHRDIYEACAKDFSEKKITLKINTAHYNVPSHN